MQRISPRTLALLRRLRVEYRDRPDIYRDLVTIAAIAETLGGASTTEIANSAGPDPSSTLTTRQAAEIAGITPNAVRRACEERRLTATKHGRDWVITRAALAEWMMRRAA